MTLSDKAREIGNRPYFPTREYHHLDLDEVRGGGIHWPGITIRQHAIESFLEAQIAYEGMEGIDVNHRVACAEEVAEKYLEKLADMEAKNDNK